MGALILGIAGVVATLALARESEGVDLLRFPLCWWSVLLALYGAVRLRHGRSAAPRAGELLLLGFGSVVFWDIFELLNLRLHDWWYVGVLRAPWPGALFSAASFATVLPAARLGAILLAPARAGLPVALHEPAAEAPPASVAGSSGPGLAAKLAGLGLALLALALAAPGTAFPLAWGFLLPLCEAALCLWPAAPGELRGPFEALRAGDRGVAARLLVLALPLGLLWECLNFSCARGWVYTVPHFETAKIFEMPAPGYLGYLPFLLEAGAANALLLRARARLRVGPAATATLLLLFAAAHLAADGAGRTGTAISLTQRFDDSQTLPFAPKLADAGLGTPRALLSAVAREGTAGVARRAGLAPGQVEEAARLATLAQVAHLGIPWAERLLRAGVRTPAELAQADPSRLRGKLAARSATDLRAWALPHGGAAAGGDDGSGAPREELLRLWMRSAARVSR
jgi:hypothetical protein